MEKKSKFYMRKIQPRCCSWGSKMKLEVNSFRRPDDSLRSTPLWDILEGSLGGLCVITKELGKDVKVLL